MLNDDENLPDGLSNSDSLDLPSSSLPSLLRVMTRLTLAMEQQNQALWALVEQTAALIESAVQETEDDEDGTSQTYLDGTRIS